jgi:dihydrofolate reductase
MRPVTAVYIATSLDGFISRDDGSFDWLFPFEDDSVFQRFESFLKTVDAIVMGRNTFLQVLPFRKWPYHDIPVYVLSSTLNELPQKSPGSAKLRCLAEDLLEELSSLRRIYVDGGITIAGFLKNDLIDELTISRIPIILGSGRTLFGPVPDDLMFEHVSTEAFANGIVQTKYARVRSAP